MPATYEQGANFLEITPALTLLGMLAIAGGEKVVIATLNAGSRVHDRLRYGPATDPHTWPSWQSIGMENPEDKRMEQLIHDLLNPSPEQLREREETRELIRGMLEAWPELASDHKAL